MEARSLGGQVFRVAHPLQLLDLPHHLLLLRLEELVHLRQQRRVLGPENARGQQPRVGGPADGDGRHRDALGHLHDRQQRVIATEGRRLDGHAHHRQTGQRGHHPGKVGRPACARNDHLNAPSGGRLGVRVHAMRCAVRRDDGQLVFHAERFQYFGCVLHHREIRVTAHDNAHPGPAIPQPVLLGGDAQLLHPGPEGAEGVRHDGDVRHLAAEEALGLAVPVGGRPRHRQGPAHDLRGLLHDALLVLAQDVDHHGRAHGEGRRRAWQPQDGAEVHLELVMIARLDGVMTSVVWPGGNLVQQNGVVGQQEELDAVDADAVERPNGPQRHVLCRLQRRGRDAGGRRDQVADVVLLHALDHREGPHAVRRADHHHGQLLHERGPLFRINLFAPQLLPRRRHLVLSLGHCVAPPIVRQLAVLQHQWVPELPPSLVCRVQRGARHELGHGDGVLCEVLFLDELVLDGADGGRTWVHHMPRRFQLLQNVDVDVLDFGGDHV
mmetsp:Transcript_45450/g.74202  ORF Transcript_45450/g.74202 Transcript_45450/m.74202 type:complete len:495 (+) Transcript_45450:49-1533(+)